MQQPTTRIQAAEHAHELAWAGQHAAAIERCTQALADTALSEAERIDLLDIRAESLIAVGRFDLAMQDAEAMRACAAAAQVLALTAQSLNRMAVVQMRVGDLQAAVDTATRAVEIGHGLPRLRATSLLCLGEAQFRVQQNEVALETAQQAAALFQDMGDDSGIGRSYWIIANASKSVGRPQDQRSFGSLALECCQRAGDSYGIGNALNTLSQIDGDLVEVLQRGQQCIQAFETAGYVERVTMATGNLALTVGNPPQAAALMNMKNEIRYTVVTVFLSIVPC